MDNLRTRIIRLAHARPDLRDDLLPLLQEGTPDNNKVASGGFTYKVALPPGFSKWQHPTRSVSQGEFKTKDEARAWAMSNVPDIKYRIVLYEGKYPYALRVYKYFSDSSSGYLMVPLADLDEFGVTHKISDKSFKRGDWAYLEEDMDMPIFIDAIKRTGQPAPRVDDVYEPGKKIWTYTPFR